MSIASEALAATDDAGTEESESDSSDADDDLAKAVAQQVADCHGVTPTRLHQWYRFTQPQAVTPTPPSEPPPKRFKARSVYDRRRYGAYTQMSAPSAPSSGECNVGAVAAEGEGGSDEEGADEAAAGAGDDDVAEQGGQDVAEQGDDECDVGAAATEGEEAESEADDGDDPSFNFTLPGVKFVSEDDVMEIYEEVKRQRGPPPPPRDPDKPPRTRGTKRRGGKHVNKKRICLILEQAGCTVVQGASAAQCAAANRMRANTEVVHAARADGGVDGLHGAAGNGDGKRTKDWHNGDGWHDKDWHSNGDGWHDKDWHSKGDGWHKDWHGSADGWHKDSHSNGDGWHNKDWHGGDGRHNKDWHSKGDGWHNKDRHSKGDGWHNKDWHSNGDGWHNKDWHGSADGWRKR